MVLLDTDSVGRPASITIKHNLPLKGVLWVWYINTAPLPHNYWPATQILAYSDSTEIDLMETVTQHTPHHLILVGKILQGNKFPRKVTTPTAVIPVHPLWCNVQSQSHGPCSIICCSWEGGLCEVLYLVMFQLKPFDILVFVLLWSL